MNIFSKLRSKQKTLIIAGSLLFGLALTPAASIAANAEHHGNRHAENNNRHQNNGHHDKRGNANRRYYVIEDNHRDNHKRKYKYKYKYKYQHKHKHNRRQNHHKHRNHYHNDPRYVIINNERHYSEPTRLQIGVHTGDFDIIFRD